MKLVARVNDMVCEVLTFNFRERTGTVIFGERENEILTLPVGGVDPRLSTGMTDKNGTDVLVGDRLNVQDGCELEIVFTDGTHYWCASEGEIGYELTPELAATMEVVA
jgi:hypothetical protein